MIFKNDALLDYQGLNDTTLKFMNTVVFICGYIIFKKHADFEEMGKWEGRRRKPEMVWCAHGSFMS